MSENSKTGAHPLNGCLFFFSYLQEWFFLYTFVHYNVRIYGGH